MIKLLVNLETINKEKIIIPWLAKYKKLQSLGCKISIHTGFFIRPLEPIEDLYNYRWLSLKQSRILSLGKITKTSFIFHAIKRNLLALSSIREVLKNNYDVVNSPSAVLNLVIFPYVIKSINKKIVWTVTLDNIVPISDPGNKVIRFLAWIFFRVSLILLRKADIIFVISLNLRDFLLKEGFEEDQIVVTTNGIENELIKKAKKDEKYKIDALFVGRINETKGIYDMLKVLAIVKKEYPHFQFAVMGDGDETTKRQFKEKVREMGLVNNIRFLGYRNGLEKFKIIKSSKCFWFLSVSDSESFGVALLEAVCCGLPAFVYDLAPFRDIYKNNEVLVFKKNDYKAVAKKVIELFKNRNFANSKGKLLLDKYDWGKIAEIEFSSFKKIVLHEKHL